MTDLPDGDVPDKDETRILLERGARRSGLADKYEAKAVKLADLDDPSTIGLSADYFIVAAALRGRARFIP